MKDLITFACLILFTLTVKSQELKYSKSSDIYIAAINPVISEKGSLTGFDFDTEPCEIMVQKYFSKSTGIYYSGTLKIISPITITPKKGDIVLIKLSDDTVIETSLISNPRPQIVDNEYRCSIRINDAHIELMSKANISKVRFNYNSLKYDWLIPVEPKSSEDIKKLKGLTKDDLLSNMNSDF